MLRNKWFGIMIISILSMIMLIGCSKDDSDNIMSPGVTEKTNVRVVHGSFDAPAVDIWVDGVVAISGLNYKETSGYAELNAGSRNIKVTPAGASTPVVIEANLDLMANTDYTVFATGELSSIGAVVTQDDRVQNSSKAKVRFLHASPDAPAVDIKVNTGSGATVFGNTAFDAITDYAAVDPGNYTFVVTPAGANTEVAVFDPIALAANTVYTVVAFGTLDPNDSVPFSVRAFVDNAAGNVTADFSFATAMLKVTHASPDAPGVDLLIDNTVINTSALNFPGSTDYVVLNAGTRNVKVNASGTSTSVINADVTFRQNMNYSIFAVDFLANIAPIVIEDDLTLPAAGKAHVRFLHASPDAPMVDITLTDGTVVFDDIEFKEVTSYLPLDASTYDLQVRTADGMTVVLNLPGITLEDGKIYTVFAKGSLNGTGGQNLGAEIISNN